jgi:hypothetical protein
MGVDSAADDQVTSERGRAAVTIGAAGAGVTIAFAVRPSRGR